MSPALSIAVVGLCRCTAGDIDTIAGLLAPDVSYHDMIYEEPFQGREEVVAYLRKVRVCVCVGGGQRGMIALHLTQWGQTR